MLRVLHCLPVDKNQTLQQDLLLLTFSVKITPLHRKPKLLVFSLRITLFHNTTRFYVLDPQSGMLLFCLSGKFLICPAFLIDWPPWTFYNCKNNLLAQVTGYELLKFHQLFWSQWDFLAHSFFLVALNQKELGAAETLYAALLTLLPGHPCESRTRGGMCLRVQIVTRRKEKLTGPYVDWLWLGKAISFSKNWMSQKDGNSNRNIEHVFMLTPTLQCSGRSSCCQSLR